MAFHVLIIDADTLRRGRWLDCIGDALDLTPVASGSDVLLALETISDRSRVDVLLINADQPRMARGRQWAQLRAHFDHHVHVAALTTGDDHSVLEATLAAGVMALHPPSIEPGMLQEAVRSAAVGELHFDPELVQQARQLIIEPLDPEQIVVGGLVVDEANSVVTRWGKVIDLSPTEFALLVRLARDKNRTVSRAELLRSVWQTSIARGGTDDQLRSSVKRLRGRIEPDRLHPRYLFTVHGHGYVLRDLLEDAPSD